MNTSLLPVQLQPDYNSRAIRRTSTVLLVVTLAELLVWLVSALRCYYGSSAGILLPVQVSTAFVAAHQPLSTILHSAAGEYFTGTQGTLLYRPQSLSDLFFFYTVGDLTFLDALFFAGLGLYLYQAQRKLAAGHNIILAIGRAMQHVAIAAMCLFVLKMVFATAATNIFWARTHYQFQLLSNRSTGGIYYPIFGLVLVICGKLLEQKHLAEPGNEKAA